MTCRRKTNFIIGVLFVISMFITSIFFISNQVVAESTIITKQKGLTIYPIRSEIGIDPGMSFDGELTVFNSTDQSMTVNFSAEEFKVINQQYDYAFKSESDITKWVNFVPSLVNLESGQSRQIKYTVGVPLSAEPGGRYIGLFASSDVVSADNSVGFKKRVSSLLYITVLGNVTRIGNLISLSSPWFIANHGEWSAMIQNTGSAHYRSDYNVTVQTIFGQKVGSIFSGDSLILPNTIRAVSNKIPLLPFPGIYKIIYSIGLGDSPTAVETRYILYLPTLVIIAITSIIVVVCLVLLRIKRKKH